MGHNVFANTMEVACKAASGKSICAFPDVCMTPPENPATPPGVPIPYPNTGMASDMTAGSKNTKIAGKEILLRDKSHLKKSMGNEAGCAAKKGVVTSVNRGKVYFAAWSMDVKVEGLNVVRHLDLTTHNHASLPSNSPTWPYVSSMAMSDPSNPCIGDQIKEMTACKDYKPHNPSGKDACAEAGLGAKPSGAYDITMSMPSGDVQDSTAAMEAKYDAESSDCIRARRCALQQYDSKKTNCCPGQTPHHIVEASSFFKKGVGNGRGGSEGGVASVPIPGIDVSSPKTGYREGKAPCVCAEGKSQNVGSHGLMHTHQSVNNKKFAAGTIQYAGDSTPSPVAHKATYKDAKESGVEAFAEVFSSSDCDPACLKKQLDDYHSQANIDDNTEVEACVTGGTNVQSQEYASGYFSS